MQTEKNVCRTIQEWERLNQDFSGLPLEEYTMRMDFMCRMELCTIILINFRDQKIEIQNRTMDVIHRAFGIKEKPAWSDFEEFLEDRCFPRTRDHLRLVLDDLGLDFYDPLAIIEKTKGKMAEDLQWIQITYFCPERAAKMAFPREEEACR